MKLFTFVDGNVYGHSIPNLFRSRFGSNLRNTVWLDTAKYQVVPAETSASALPKLSRIHVLLSVCCVIV
jgi:hypothetical protein